MTRLDEAPAEVSGGPRMTEPVTSGAAGLPDDTPVLERHPELRYFRARLGGTTLLDVPAPAGGARIVAKCEFENPTGSVKDRVAYALLCRAVLEHEGPGPLKLLDYSGGSLVRSFGQLGRITGIPMRFAVPSTIPDSWLRQITASGVRVDPVPVELGIAGIIDRAFAVKAEDPSWTLLHQMRNEANVAVHEWTTGQEVLAQLDGRRPTHWVAAIGTGGTLTGVARALRREFPDLVVLGNTPGEMPYGTEGPPNGLTKFAGSGGLGHGVRQPFVAGLAADADHRSVEYGAALDAMVRFEARTGLRIGTSAAANWQVAWETAAALGPDDLVVTVFPDAGAAEEWERAYARAAS
ncbi:pyridoxal-phosphate dependent enzyme [Kitasatospora purpeofusca]|uniref:pyridoxal-phosphate dependent enzyme n=1 Tax=Kitasatospora purpeofusca TaxID=67352 RepID=UPI0036917851